MLNEDDEVELRGIDQGQNKSQNEPIKIRNTKLNNIAYMIMRILKFMKIMKNTNNICFAGNALLLITQT